MRVNSKSTGTADGNESNLDLDFQIESTLYINFFGFNRTYLQVAESNRRMCTKLL